LDYALLSQREEIDKKRWRRKSSEMTAKMFGSRHCCLILLAALPAFLQAADESRDAVPSELDCTPSAPASAQGNDFVKQLQNSVQKATNILKDTGKLSDDKLGRLGQMPELCVEHLKLVSPGSGVRADLDKSIASTEAKIQSYGSEANSPNLSSETRSKYAGLKNRLARLKADLCKSTAVVDKKRVSLEACMSETREDFEFLADLFAAKDWQFVEILLPRLFKRQEELETSLRDWRSIWKKTAE
jgi:hypothetical protein